MAQAVRQNLLKEIEDLKWDLWLGVVTIGLVVFGIVMVYSASVASRSPHRFLISQIIWATVGLIAMARLRRVDYHFYAQPKFVYGFLGVCFVLLLAVFLFAPINGAHRWIHFKGVSGQPSELVKIGLVLFLAWFLSEREQDGELDDFWATVAPASVVVGLMAVLILREPDLGTTLMLGLVFVAMMFAAGVPLKHLFKLSPIMILGAIYMVVKVAWRWDRIEAFIDPEKDPLGKGYHILQSLTAIGSGGVNGLGFGQSKQKLLFLPTPQSDFIFAVISEELGLIGAATLILAFGFFLWRGLLIARRAPDLLGQLIAIGLTSGLILQAFFNMSVAIKLLPAKGITLPFVSAGGSSLVVALAMVGILLNISEQVETAGKD